MGEHTHERANELEGDALMPGAILHAHPELASLVRFVDDVREVYTVTPDAAVRERHLAAMVEASRQALATQVAGGTDPTSNGQLNGQVGRPAPARRWRSRPLIRGGIAAVAVLLVSGSALASVGSLPGPAQNAFARVARFVGVDLPHTDRTVRTPRSATNGSRTFPNGASTSGAAGATGKRCLEDQKCWDKRGSKQSRTSSNDGSSSQIEVAPPSTDNDDADPSSSPGGDGAVVDPGDRGDPDLPTPAPTASPVPSEDPGSSPSPTPSSTPRPDPGTRTPEPSASP
jgi:hypothetical protein